jgi:hypothetical protein
MTCDASPREKALELLRAYEIRRGEFALRDALARVVWIREEFDQVVREQALENLEHDLAATLAQLENRAA